MRITMNKKEVLEIRKQFSNENCAITRICGCYVDGEKQIRTTLKEAFLSLPEEEIFKYYEIFKKTLSGTIGKNLIQMEFPTMQEMPDGTQAWLLKLRDSQLKDENLIEEFYQKIIKNYHYEENYYIILIHAAYDIPKKTEDNIELFDASDEVYEYLLCSICPVKLSKAGLCYNAEKNNIENRTRDWLIEVPDTGFLFPAFHDRRTDVHNILYYTKNPEALQNNLLEEVFGCQTPLSAKEQKENFQELLQETLKEQCSYDTIINIHETLNELIEDQKDSPEPVQLSKTEIKQLLLQSGAEEESLENFEEQFDVMVGEHTTFLASNLTNQKTMEVKTANIHVKVDTEKAALLETRIINGRPYLLIPVSEQLEVNGVTLSPLKISEENLEETDI